MKHVVSEVSLDNGAKGIFINIPDASVMSFEINFRAGEYLLPRDKAETPHVMEHLLLGANEFVPKSRDFQAEFEKNGAYCNASTGTYEITYEAECADFEWERINDLLQAAVSKPLFLEEEFIAEVGNIREELVGRSNNHFRHLSLALREDYGLISLTDQERLEVLNNVELTDVWQHYRKTHTTSNMRFVIAGKLPATRQKSLVKSFNKILMPEGQGRFEIPVEVPHKLEAPLYINNDTVKNLYFYIDTFILRQIDNSEMDALNLLNIMMTETMYSKIFGAAREKGLVYHMSSGYGQGKDSANWWLASQVSPKNALALFDIFVAEIQKIFKSKLDDEDIKAAKQYALGRFQRSGQTVGGTMAGYTGRYFFDGIIDDYYLIPERINAVTKEAIVSITKELFSKDIWGIGGLGSSGEDFLVALEEKISPLWK
jgi:predicted Zn-dependent peptidase